MPAHHVRLPTHDTCLLGCGTQACVKTGVSDAAKAYMLYSLYATELDLSYSCKLHDGRYLDLSLCLSYGLIQMLP